MLSNWFRYYDILEGFMGEWTASRHESQESNEEENSGHNSGCFTDGY